MLAPRSSPVPPSHFAIGDVHGCASELQLLLKKLPLNSQSTVVFLGDYIDRGPHSRQVIETILELKKTCNVVALKGNHEDLLLSFLKDPESKKSMNFIMNGGGATLASYSDSFGNWSIPSEHMLFFKNLRLCYEWESYVFVHANVPDMPYEWFVPKDSEEDLLWSRQSFASRAHPWTQTVVHGHTPAKQALISDSHINLDTGCVYSHLLTAMEFPSRRIYSVSSLGKPEQVFLRDKDMRRESKRYKGTAPVYIDLDAVRLDFETIDYNELGLLLRSCSFSSRAWLKQHQTVHGYIGSDEHHMLAFDGTVVRVELEEGEYRYAIRTTQALQLMG